jgi:hypothetical protein
VPRLPHLEISFPKLSAAGYDWTSDATGPPNTPGTYNCIAWAAGDTKHDFWWPVYGYWPLFWVRREATVLCFVKTFRWLGYRLCEHSNREVLYDKLALYAIHKSHRPMPIPQSLPDFIDWEPTHMARQLKDGSWTSKCGRNEDITHFTLDALESYGPLYGAMDEYGCNVLYMKRLVLISWIVRAIQWIRWKIESFT